MDFERGAVNTLLIPGRELETHYLLVFQRIDDRSNYQYCITENTGSVNGPLLLGVTETDSATAVDGEVTLGVGDWQLTVYGQDSASNLDAANANRTVSSELVSVLSDSVDPATYPPGGGGTGTAPDADRCRYIRVCGSPTDGQVPTWNADDNTWEASDPSGGSGSVGPTGPQGPAGSDGADGADGAIGPQGPQGIQGIQGETGATGPTGPQGPQGDPGADGADGATGAQGPQGDPGVDGADGSDGATGATGPAGPAPSGSGLVSVTAGVLDTPSTLRARVTADASNLRSDLGLGSAALLTGVEGAEAAYTGTDTYTAGAQPSGASSKSQFYTRVGNKVSWQISITHANAATTCTNLSLTFPTEFPTPHIITGFTGANARIWNCDMVRLLASPTGALSNANGFFIMRNSGDNGFVIASTAAFTSGTYRCFILSGIYYTS